VSSGDRLGAAETHDSAAAFFLGLPDMAGKVIILDEALF
jgi:hypothetical protein